MTSFLDLAYERRSVRAFTDAKVTDEQLELILEAANSAPSAGDLQAYEVVVVRDGAAREALAAAAHQPFVADAAAVLVFLTNPERSARHYGPRGRALYCIQDATIACAYAQLAATDVGLASTWIGALDEPVIRTVVGAPPDLDPVALLPVGVPAEKPLPTPRRPLSDLAHDELYGRRLSLES